jgi:putative DNA primase/helicase
MANIYPDLPAVALKETDVFKTLVSGEMVEGEEKFKPLFSFTNIAKLIFSCNQVPPTPDNSVAFFRRWIIIMFPNQFLESNPKTNPNLIRELTTPEELSGILNWALEGLAALEKQSKFTVSKTTEDVRIQYAFLSDPVKAFADTKLEPSFEDEYLEKTEVYETYLKFCETFKLPTISKKAFAEELPQHSTATAAATTVGGREGERVRIWRGIKFKVAEDSEE